MREAAEGAEAAQGTTEPAQQAPRDQAPSSRAGKRAVVGYLSQDQWRELRWITINEDTSVQQLVVEAVEDLLRRRRQASGSPPK